MSKKDKNTKAKSLVISGVELASGAIAGALGFLAAGPAGAAAAGAGGVVVSKTLSRMGDELSERLLGPRERVRIGATMAIAANEISERIKKGEKIRSDGFFEKNDPGRSNADELAESVLLKSQKEPEEKKVPLLAHLLANIVFRQEIDIALGEQILKAVEQLTYRQLCILRLAARSQEFKLRDINYRGMKNFPRELYYDLYNRSFINNGSVAALGMTDLVPAKMSLQGLGVDIHNWMQLWQISDEDIKPLTDVLSK